MTVQAGHVRHAVSCVVPAWNNMRIVFLSWRWWQTSRNWEHVCKARQGDNPHHSLTLGLEHITLCQDPCKGTRIQTHEHAKQTLSTLLEAHTQVASQIVLQPLLLARGVAGVLGSRHSGGPLRVTVTVDGDQLRYGQAVRSSSTMRRYGQAVRHASSLALRSTASHMAEWKWVHMQEAEMDGRVTCAARTASVAVDLYRLYCCIVLHNCTALTKYLLVPGAEEHVAVQVRARDFIGHGPLQSFSWKNYHVNQMIQGGVAGGAEHADVPWVEARVLGHQHPARVFCV